MSTARAPQMVTHPAADLFPLMEGEDLDRLVESIRQTGFDRLQPIVVDREGLIIDGRNRWRACELAGVDPITVTYEGDDPFGEAVRLNIVRRHLSASQIAGILVKSNSLRAAQAEAKERQSAAGGGAGRAGGDGRTLPPRGVEAFRGEATEIVAREHGIGGETLRRAQVVERDAPDLLPALISGDMSAREGERQAAVRTILAPEQAPAGSPSSRGKPERSEVHRKTRNFDSARIVRESASILGGLASSVGQVDLGDLSAEERAEWAPLLKESLKTLNRFARRLGE